MDRPDRWPFRPTISHKRPRTENYSSPFNSDLPQPSSAHSFSTPRRSISDRSNAAFDATPTPIRHPVSAGDMSNNILSEGDHLSDEEGSDFSDDTFMSDGFSLASQEHDDLADPDNDWGWTGGPSDFDYMDPDAEAAYIEALLRQELSPGPQESALGRANLSHLPVIDLTSDNDASHAAQHTGNRAAQPSPFLLNSNNDRSSVSAALDFNHQNMSRNLFGLSQNSGGNPGGSDRDFGFPGNNPPSTGSSTAGTSSNLNRSSSRPDNTSRPSARGPNWTTGDFPWIPRQTDEERNRSPASWGAVDLPSEYPTLRPDPTTTRLRLNDPAQGSRHQSDRMAGPARPGFTFGADVVDLTDDTADPQATAGAEPSSPEIQFISQHRVPRPRVARPRPMDDLDVDVDMEILGSNTRGGPAAAAAARHRFGATGTRQTSGLATAGNASPHSRLMAVIRPMLGSLVARHVPFAYQMPDMNFTAVGFDMGVAEPRREPATPPYHAPPPAPDGFTRTPEEGEELVCPNCGNELCAGDDPDRKQVWVVKTCGHVYCGRCTKSRSKSSRGKGKKNVAELPPPFKNCVVEGCGKLCSGRTQMVQLFL